MICNIPNKYNSELLIKIFNKSHKDKYDFLHLPMDTKVIITFKLFKTFRRIRTSKKLTRDTRLLTLEIKNKFIASIMNSKGKNGEKSQALEIAIRLDNLLFFLFP